ncbi:MAG TPA: DinB family protein [Dehalococcoidia bacterium]|nr:DinB family protein [Dehalococcoidia bacterium]
MSNQPITGNVFGQNQPTTREFLLEESEKPLTELLSLAEAARAGLVASLHGVSEAQASFKPAPGAGEEDAYSIIEVLRHVTASSGTMALRIRALGLDTEIPERLGPGSFGDVESMPLSQLAPRLAATLTAVRDAVAAIDGHERLDTTTPHRAYGELNCRGYLRLMALHEQDHARQVAAIKAMPGYPER